METLLDAHFSDRSPTGLIRLLDKGGVAESHFDALGTGIYVALPALFVIQGGESVIAGPHEHRLHIHLRSNNVHTRETLQLMFERLKNQSTEHGNQKWVILPPKATTDEEWVTHSSVYMISPLKKSSF